MTQRPVPAAVSLLVLDHLAAAVGKPVRTMAVITSAEVDESQALERLPWSERPPSEFAVAATAAAPVVQATAPVAQAAAPNPTTFPFKRSGGGVTPTTEGRGVSASYALGFTPREPKFFAGHFERTDTGTYCTFMGCAQEAKRIGARWTIYAGTMYDAPDSGGGTYHPIPVVWVETAGVVAGYRWLPEGRDGDADFGHIRTDAEMHQDYPLRGLQWFATAIGEIVRDTNLPLTLAEAPNLKIGASLPHLAFLAGSLDDEYRRTMHLSDKDQAVYYAVSLNQREVRDLCIAVALSGEGHVVTQRVERDSSDIGSSVLFAAEYLRPATPKLIWDAPKTVKSDAQVLADWDRDVLVRDWYATLQHIKPLSPSYYTSTFAPGDIRPGDKFMDTHGTWVVRGRAAGTPDTWEVKLRGAGSGHEIAVSGDSLRDHYTRIHDDPATGLIEDTAPALAPVTVAAPTTVSAAATPDPVNTAAANVDTTFIMPGYGTIKIVLGARGQREVWNNIFIGSTQYGWNGKRWSRKTVPPDAVLQAIAQRGITAFSTGPVIRVATLPDAETPTTRPTWAEDTERLRRLGYTARPLPHALPGTEVLAASNGQHIPYATEKGARDVVRVLGGEPWGVYRPGNGRTFWVGRRIADRASTDADKTQPIPEEWTNVASFWLESAMRLVNTWGSGPSASPVVSKLSGAVESTLGGHTVQLRMTGLTVDPGTVDEVHDEMHYLNQSAVDGADWLAPHLGLPRQRVPRSPRGPDYSYADIVASGEGYHDLVRYAVGDLDFDPVHGWGAEKVAKRFEDQNVNAVGFVVWLTPSQLAQLTAGLPDTTAMAKLPPEQAARIPNAPPELVVSWATSRLVVSAHKRTTWLIGLGGGSAIVEHFPVHVFMAAGAQRPTEEWLRGASLTSADWGSTVFPVLCALGGALIAPPGRAPTTEQTHDIAELDGTRKPVKTLLRAGQYAVHNNGQIGANYTVSHVPSGISYYKFSTLAEARDFIDFVHAELPSIGAGATFGVMPNADVISALTDAKDRFFEARPERWDPVPAQTPAPVPVQSPLRAPVPVRPVVTPQLPPPLPTAAYVSKPAAPKPVAPPKPPRSAVSYVETSAGASPLSTLRKEAARQGYVALECIFEAIAYKDVADFEEHGDSHQGMTDIETVEYLQGEARYLIAGRVWDVFVYRKKGKSKGDLLTNIMLLFK